ncbi:capsid assembly scaffolding protein Gp46 family protein, partial [Clostridium perfringens]
MENNNVDNTNTEVLEGEKSVQEGVDATGKVTLEQFKSTLEDNLECKGYFDSLVDKTVNSRLDKSIESWKSKNLENIINEEINKKYPQKTEAEVKFEEQQKALEKAQEEKRQLELQIKYQDLMARNNLPMDILDFVAGKDIETTITNI